MQKSAAYWEGYNAGLEKIGLRRIQKEWFKALLRSGRDSPEASRLGARQLLTKLRKGSPIKSDSLDTRSSNFVKSIEGLSKSTHPSRARTSYAREVVLDPLTYRPVRGKGIDRGILRQVMGSPNKGQLV